MKIIVIAAMARNRTIGDKGEIPWMGKFPEDMKHFKNLTTGHAVVMGRKTFESINCTPLKNRENIVVSRKGNDEFQFNCQVRDSLEGAINHCRVKGHTSCYIIGGEQVYREALAIADEIVLTVIEREFQGDAKFPQIDQQRFQCWGVESGENPTFSYHFEYWHRKR